jgi:hypothetical protein
MPTHQIVRRIGEANRSVAARSGAVDPATAAVAAGAKAAPPNATSNCSVLPSDPRA